MSELPTMLMFFKVGTAVLMVVGLSVLAEAVSPRFAGILSGYPLGAAISLFFIGLEIGPEFAAQSALSTMLGLIATLVFAYGYHQCSVLAGRLNKGNAILLASTGGICAYFLAAGILHLLPTNPALSLLLPAVAIGWFHYLFRNIEDVEIAAKVRWTLRLLLFRALFAAAAVILVTSTAGLVGAGWAGLFAAFPMTMLPLVVIVHYTYDAPHAHTVLKGYPKGLGSLVIYTLAVFHCYPQYGVIFGTLAAYAFATLYLVVTQFFRGDRPARETA